jgi:hypothetical protein
MSVNVDAEPIHNLAGSFSTQPLLCTVANDAAITTTYPVRANPDRRSSRDFAASSRGVDLASLYSQRLTYSRWSISSTSVREKLQIDTRVESLAETDRQFKDVIVGSENDNVPRRV